MVVVNAHDFILNNIIWLALVFAALLILGSGVNIRRAYPLKACMGKAQWDFSSSWAMSFTTVGTLLATVLGAQNSSLVPYTAFDLFFGLLVLLAPIVYNATDTLQPAITATPGTSPGKDSPTPGQAARHQNPVAQEVPQATPGTSTPDQQANAPPQRLEGQVWGFLLASLLTLWGVFGELGTIFPLLKDLAIKDTTTTPPTTESIFQSPLDSMFWVALALALVIVGCYAIRSIQWTVEAQIDAMKKPACLPPPEVVAFAPQPRRTLEPEQLNEWNKPFTTPTEGLLALERQPIILQVNYPDNPHPPTWSLL